MEFGRCLQTFDWSERGGILAVWAFDKMMQKAKTFNQWRNVFYRASAGSVVEMQAFLQATTLAKTFGQWLWIYEELCDMENIGDDLMIVKKISVKQLMELVNHPKDADWTKDKDAISLRRWEKIFSISPQSSGLDCVAFKKIIELKDLNKKEEIQKKKERRSLSSSSKI